MKSDIDLNLLKLLPLLHRHKKMKSVAKILGKSEASVSKYLARLREQFDDELFTLDPHNGYVATQLMVEMLPELESGLSQLEETLHRRPFDKSSYDKEIVIALPQFPQYCTGHLALKKVMQEFPNARVSITGWDEETIHKIIENQVDIGFQYFSSQIPKTIYQKIIGRNGISVLVPENKAGISLEDALKLPFVMPQAKGWSDNMFYDEFVEELLEMDLNVIATVDNITCLFNSVVELGAATIMSAISKPLPGFHAIPLDIPLEKIPASCVMMKAQNRHNAFHQALIKTLESTYSLYRMK